VYKVCPLRFYIHLSLITLAMQYNANDKDCRIAIARGTDYTGKCSDHMNPNFG